MWLEAMAEGEEPRESTDDSVDRADLEALNEWALTAPEEAIAAEATADLDDAEAVEAEATDAEASEPV
jgi:hypothetical protein